MKRSVRFLVIVASLLLITALTVTSVLAARDPFKGFWESIDTVDGSYQTLHIGGGPGNTYNVRYYDYGATICGLDPDTGDILYAASARGRLTGSGNDLTGTMSAYCRTRPPEYLFDIIAHYIYDPSTDTFTDDWGVVWNRK